MTTPLLATVRRPGYGYAGWAVNVWDGAQQVRLAGFASRPAAVAHLRATYGDVEIVRNQPYDLAVMYAVLAAGRAETTTATAAAVQTEAIAV